jgi:SAM-dependent methyltransferase
MPIEDESLDGIISWGVIEHDEAGPGEALRDFLRVLRPGGWIFVSVPVDSASQRAASEVVFKDQKEGGVFFQYFFTPSELGDVVRKAGFEVDEVVPCGRHYALALPRTYARMVRAPGPVQFLAYRLLNGYARLRNDTWNMILAIARKPR